MLMHSTRKKKIWKTKIRLEDISKTDPFRVPDNYFEQFNEEIMNRLPAIKTPEFRHVPLREKVNHGFIWQLCLWDYSLQFNF